MDQSEPIVGVDRERLDKITDEEMASAAKRARERYYGEKRGQAEQVLLGEYQEAIKELRGSRNPRGLLVLRRQFRARGLSDEAMGQVK